MRIAAVDPGKMCGLAFVILGSEDNRLAAVKAGMDDLDKILNKWKPEIVIVERFVLYPFALQRLKFHSCPAAEAIGVVRSWCNRNEVPLVRAMASVRVPYLPTARALIGFVDHRADALGHILCWLKVNEPELLMKSVILKKEI